MATRHVKAVHRRHPIGTGHPVDAKPDSGIVTGITRDDNGRVVVCIDHGDHRSRISWIALAKASLKDRPAPTPDILDEHPAPLLAELSEEERAQTLKRYRDLLKAIEPTLKPGRIAAPELGYTFGFSKGDAGKAELLHAILHTGNESNKRKLLLGHGWADLRRQDLAGLGYHSPNMALAHGRHLQRGATAFDQEAIATLILSGRFVGFLPEHYAQAFVQRGQMRAVSPAKLHYRCDFVSVLRRSPQPARAALAFQQALRAAHAASHPPPSGQS